VSNIVFRNVQFHGGGGQTTYGANPNPADVVCIGSTWKGSSATVTNVTFDACTFEANVGVEDAARTREFMGVAIKTGNGIGDSTVSGLLFRNCRFLAGSTNIVVEMWQDYSVACNVGFSNINFDGCDFGSSWPCAVDYSGGTNSSGQPSSGFSYVNNCTFHGYMSPGAGLPWSIVVEKGAGSVTWSNNTYLP
jgi:hypothetical protein